MLRENEEMKDKIKQLKIRNQELQDENANLTNEMEILRTQMDILHVTCEFHFLSRCLLSSADSTSPVSHGQSAP